MMEDKNEVSLETILDRMSYRVFAQLSEEEKLAVLALFTEQEYNELCIAAQQLKNHFDESVSPSERVFKNLEQKFAPSSKQKNVLQKRIEIWKVAAIVLPLFCGFLWSMRNAVHVIPTEKQLVHDTVFIKNKILKPQHLVDTIYVVKNQQLKSIKSISKPNKNSEVPIFALQNADVDSNREMNKQALLQIGVKDFNIDDLEKAKRQVNGTSMDEDSLLQHFSFAKI